MFGLRLTLALLALYLGLLGLLFVIAQPWAVLLLEIGAHDPVALRQWGVSLLLLSAVVGILARDPRGFRRLLWVPLAGLPLASAALAYDLVTGATGLRQVGPPLVINLGLFVLLVLFVPRASAGGAASAESSPPGVTGSKYVALIGHLSGPRAHR